MRQIKTVLGFAVLVQGVSVDVLGQDHIEEIVFVTGELNKKASETALPIIVLEGEKLRAEVANSLGETISNQAGVHNSSFGSGTGKPVIRGQSENRVQVLTNGLGNQDGVLGIFPRKRTKTSGARVISGLSEGITFPELAYIHQLRASAPQDPVTFHSIRSYRYP